MPISRPALSVTLFFAMLLSAANMHAYSVLTHEELIDLAWNDSIRPLLLSKFPKATEHQLVLAHSYAYGGCAIQDMGYYPFGKRFFSNLTHYVRSGDFVAWMLQNARTIDEYAFALGVLSHYLGDSIGHSQAINPATAIEFPKLQRKYGPSVTYGETPHGHIRTEFAFDVQEMTNLEFAPPAYLRAIGFRVPRNFLERAFVHIYGFDIRSILGPDRPALKSYRTAVRSFIPIFAEAEIVIHRHQFHPHPDDEAYSIFLHSVSQTNYDRRWKHTYKGPGFKAHLLAVVVFLVPKIGAASDLAIKIPTPQTQELYLSSLNHTVDVFHGILNDLNSDPDPPVVLTNVDLDTGKNDTRGDYPLSDHTYDELLARLTTRGPQKIPRDLKHDILNYYKESSDAEQPVAERLALIQRMRTTEK